MARNEVLLVAALAVAGCSSGGNEVAVKAIPDQDSPGARILLANCTQCHGAPMPSVHTAREWVAVVGRMQNWRTTKGMGPIPDKDEAELISYLQAHGAVN